MRLFAAPVDGKRLLVARPGLFRPILFLMDVAQMADRVRQHERLGRLPHQCNGFFIRPQRPRRVTQPPLSLAQLPQGDRQHLVRA